MNNPHAHDVDVLRQRIAEARKPADSSDTTGHHSPALGVKGVSWEHSETDSDRRRRELAAAFRRNEQMEALDAHLQRDPNFKIPPSVRISLGHYREQRDAADTQPPAA